jgi:hypothetical protein
MQTALDYFAIRLTSGAVLFDDKDIESYDAGNNRFVLNRDASRRLISNLDELQRSSGTRPAGELYDADGRMFDVLLGRDQLVRGRVLSKTRPDRRPPLPSVVLFSDMPDMQDGRVCIGIGKMADDEAMKRMSKSGPDAAVTPVLGEQIARYFRRLGKVLS